MTLCKIDKEKIEKLITPNHWGIDAYDIRDALVCDPEPKSECKSYCLGCLKSDQQLALLRKQLEVAEKALKEVLIVWESVIAKEALAKIKEIGGDK